MQKLASNMSKSCATIEEAQETITIRSVEHGPCYFRPVGSRFVVYRESDDKVMKSINYFAPNLHQFFTEEEIENAKQ